MWTTHIRHTREQSKRNKTCRITGLFRLTLVIDNAVEAAATVVYYAWCVGRHDVSVSVTSTAGTLAFSNIHEKLSRDWIIVTCNC